MSLLPIDPAAWLSAIVASSSDAIISKDLHGRIYSWNPAAERMFGWTADEAIGQSIEIITPAGRAAEEDYVLFRVSQWLGIEHFETVRLRKDGALIEIYLTVPPILGPDGTIVAP